MKKALIISASVLFLAALFAMTQIPAAPVAADKASVSTDADFQMNGTTLVKYTGTAKTVSVPASVTVIGEEAFADNTEMEVLQFKGDQVETISYRAFSGCTGLREVKLPDSVQEIGDGAFGNCTGLEKITFGKELYKLGLGPFSGCTALKTIEVPKENTAFSVADGCLYNGDKTKLYRVLPGRSGDSYAMPSTVKDIAEYAFWGCDTVKAVTLSNNLKEIPDYAFANHKALAGITIPYSVTSIGVKAFSDCVNLETVMIPSNVTSIHDTAFDGCVKLLISAEEGTVADRYYTAWKDRNQAEYEDTGNSSIMAGIVSDTTENSGGQEEPSEEGNVLASTHVVGNSAVLFIDNTEQTVYGNAAQGSAGAVLQGTLTQGEVLPKYTIAFDTVVADQAFYKSGNVSGYQIPEGITEIGEFSFARSNLSRVDIPAGVKEIGYGAFYHCDYLRDVKIPSSVTSIAPKAFAESLWLKNWLAGSGNEEYLIVGDGILLAYRGNGGSLELPDTVKRIAPEAFVGNDEISSVYLPDSVIEVGEDAFCGCKNLKTVTGGKNVQIIRDRAFKDCPLETAHVWEKVGHIGLNSFDFSQTALSVSNKVVVFDSAENIPIPSYELTASRLSNGQARGMLLGDTSFAIVEKGIKAEDLAGTVLSPQAYGFKGIVACITSHDKGIVTCIATTYTQEEFADAYIPEYITIDGKSYQVTGADAITSFGMDREYPDGTLTVSNQSSRLPGSVSAVLEDNNGAYDLVIKDSDTAYNALNRGYEALYQQQLPENVSCVDISLVDKYTGVPITKTGNQALTLTVALPETLSGGGLSILTTDRNGQLENIPYTREGNTVTFTTNHLSAFAFCGVAQQPKVYAEFPVTINRNE